MSFPKELYLCNFNSLLIRSCGCRHLPSGKLFPQFCEGKGEADQPIFMLRKMDAREKVPSSTVFVAMSDLAAAGKITGMALAEALRGDAAKLAYGNSCSKGSLSCKGVAQGDSSTAGLTCTSSNGH